MVMVILSVTVETDIGTRTMFVIAQGLILTTGVDIAIMVTKLQFARFPPKTTLHADLRDYTTTEEKQYDFE